MASGFQESLGEKLVFQSVRKDIGEESLEQEFSPNMLAVWAEVGSTQVSNHCIDLSLYYTLDKKYKLD